MSEEKKAEEKKEEKKGEGHEAEGGEGKAKKKKFPIIWLLIGLLTVLGSAGGTFLFLTMKGGGEATKKEKKGKLADEHSKEGAAGEEEGEEHEGEAGGEQASEEGDEHAEEGHDEEGGGHGEAKANCPVHEGGGEHAKAPKMDETYPLEPFIVNLTGEAEKNFLKVTIKLKLAKKECYPLLEPYVAEMRDSILLLLSSKNYDTIKTVQGKMELRDEVLERVQHIVKGNKVKGAFFTEFVAQ